MIAGGKTMLLQAGFSQIAAALADPAREAIVAALADGRALPAGELAAAAGISPQSASAHLQQLVDCGFLAVWKQGRFRYYQLSGEPAAEIIEALASFAHRAAPRPLRCRAASPEFRYGRCCYNHLAGALGVELAALLERRDYVRTERDAPVLTDAGRQWAETHGFLAVPRRATQPHLRQCLDWTERRYHLAGSVPSAILRELIARGHLRRGRQRILHLTEPGKGWFDALRCSP
jgi:DNA-binding transcriptional ArsR family regulator